MIVGCLFYQALALSWVWYWFMVPAFEAPVITTLQFVGVKLFVSLLIYKVNFDSKSYGDDLPRIIIKDLTVTTLFFSFGFLISRILTWF
jgi:hypothetical protein